MPIPSTRRIAGAGLASGLVLNLIDTPWSVLVMVPRLAPFNAAHAHEASGFAGPWFLLTHFAFMTCIAWIYALARQHYRPGPATALQVGGVLFAINRAFGIGNVLLGWISPAGFLGFSFSFAVGVTLATLLAGRIVDRGSAPIQPNQ